ncbi:YiiX/YebB-like N1pC/P60 family cysteine hydrolase [Aestuariibaculum sp. M13]|uniref:YiiX/YebB-like N1pC/P60 family cysteine hydrolase n=1 Tax=Aestuariibaculum sp. M13 TaxID=2967132 RepID=UPI002159E3B9|nr:YiiX/YebB-like N1pC/P60 family cysteine hydrolase [Aestuariibaculum sp. M13]MCR8668171.1 YiiX/YebB-like N1pC/P60 family cysteine hydrolase [Aestuariibaculum sp. M13]
MKSLFLPVFLFVCFGYAQNIELQNGDLIFQSIDCGPLCDAINQVTEGYKGHDFNHMGMVVIQNNKTLILEAAGTEVTLTPYDAFVLKTKNPMYVGRLKKRYRNLIAKAIDFGKKQLGTPYDVNYLYDNDKYYCSELIYDCFLSANGQPFFKLFPMTYKAPGSESYFKVWEDYFKKLNMEVPEGKPGCNPGGMSLSKRIKILGTL